MYACKIHFLLPMCLWFVVITQLDSSMTSQREKFSLSASTTIFSYFCGLAEAQSFCICVFSLAQKAVKHFKIARGLL